jgi:hypothetical protein
MTTGDLGRSHVVVVPGAPALLPRHTSLHDPVAAMRSAAVSGVAWLAARHPDRLTVLAARATDADRRRGVTDPVGLRVARALLAAAGFSGTVQERTAPPGLADGPWTGAGCGILVVADGSACRRPDAPGGFHPAAAGFDAAVEVALRTGDVAALRGLDESLGRVLLCAGVPVLRALAEVASAPASTHVDYADDPYGVQYWVVRWDG